MFCEGESLRVENIQKRPAWTIGAHDFDVPGIMLDDDPLLPPGQDDYPLLELLEARKQRGNFPEGDNTSSS